MLSESVERYRHYESLWSPDSALSSLRMERIVLTSRTRSFMDPMPLLGKARGTCYRD
jgi:hypothetical protein